VVIAVARILVGEAVSDHPGAITSIDRGANDATTRVKRKTDHPSDAAVGASIGRRSVATPPTW